MEISDLAIDRRQFIAGAGAAALGGCVSCPNALSDPWGTNTRALADVHAHFFNMSDLPIEGFAKYVLIPNRAPQYGGVANALGDLFGWLKRRSPTVAEEQRGLHLPIGRLPERQVSDVEFSRAVAERINAKAVAPAQAAFAGDGAGLADPEMPLDQSYGLLAAVLEETDAQGPAFAEGPPPRVSAERIQAILAGRASDSHSAGFADPGEDPCKIRQIRCTDGTDPACAPEECDEPEPAPFPRERIMTLLAWVWDLMQGRCNHVRDYLELTRTHGRSAEAWRPALVVNHLVDYDRWLDDGPATASSHDDQIAFWTDFAVARAEELRLFNFAGYDPLKHAEERLLGGSGTTQFDRLAGYFDNGAQERAGPRVAGFKLYPPMGFKPSGNRKCDYQGRERARGIVSRRWARLPHLAGKDIGEEINASLQAFFNFCLDRRAPILSHSILGNQAACCFGQRANPSHWAELFAQQPRYGALRLCLGHFVNEAACFVESVRKLRQPSPEPAPAHVWALHGTARLLQMSRRGEADVYVDIGYLSEILDRDQSKSELFSAEFFAALRWYCEQYDPECRRILFGTDWIVIGQELGYRRYVDLVLHGMAAAQWPVAWQENLLHNNLRTFLRLPVA